MFYLFIVIAILFDQTSKFLVKSGFWLQEKISFFWGFFYLQPSHNAGVAFSFPIEGMFLKILTIVLIGAIIYYYFWHESQKNELLIKIGYGCVIGGAISNAIERLFIGHVLDFIGVKYFAIFNFADIFITIGVILLFLAYSNLWNNKKS